MEEYKERSIMEPSIYYKEAFGITPEVAIENKEKLHQMEEFVESLEAEVNKNLIIKIFIFKDIY